MRELAGIEAEDDHVYVESLYNIRSKPPRSTVVLKKVLPWPGI